jgi:hypothetical protein
MVAMQRPPIPGTEFFASLKEAEPPGQWGDTIWKLIDSLNLFGEHCVGLSRANVRESHVAVHNAFYSAMHRDAPIIERLVGCADEHGSDGRLDVVLICT